MHNGAGGEVPSQQVIFPVLPVLPVQAFQPLAPRGVSRVALRLECLRAWGHNFCDYVHICIVVHICILFYQAYVNHSTNPLGLVQVVERTGGSHARV